MDQGGLGLHGSAFKKFVHFFSELIFFLWQSVCRQYLKMKKLWHIYAYNTKRCDTLQKNIDFYIHTIMPGVFPRVFWSLRYFSRFRKRPKEYLEIEDYGLFMDVPLKDVIFWIWYEKRLAWWTVLMVVSKPMLMMT